MHNCSQNLYFIVEQHVLDRQLIAEQLGHLRISGNAVSLSSINSSRSEDKMKLAKLDIAVMQSYSKRTVNRCGCNAK